MVSRKIKSLEQVVIAQPRHELLQVAEIVAREKGIERDEVLEAMEQAIQKAAKSKYGFEHDIRVEIDRTVGDVTVYRVRTVVDLIEDDLKQITLEEAKKLDETAAVGDELTETLPPVEFGASL